jgi:RNA polymerase sigma factor (sigma-70 family)
VSTGDREALQQLVVAHLPDLENFIQRRTGQRFLGKESLADLVQSAAREALAHLSQHDYQGPAPFKAWLYKVALTKIVAKHRYHTAERRDVRREEQEDSQGGLAAVCASFSTPSGAAIDKEFEQRFTAAFDRLSSEHQQVFFLARVLELPHSEIATQMNRTEQACRSQLVRAAARLGVLLGMENGSERG